MSAADAQDRDGQGPRIGPLRTRPMPRQARAVERVRVILVTSAALLDQHPPEALSTSLIAETARIPVSSIYRYFPSVEAILRELYLQTSGALRAELFALLSDEASRPTWRERLQAALAVLHRFIATHPYYRPLLLMFLAHRGPIAHGEEDHDELVRFLAARWSAGQDGFAGGDPAQVAATTVQIAIAMEDLIATQPDDAAAAGFCAEMHRALSSYLGQYLRD